MPTKVLCDCLSNIRATVLLLGASIVLSSLGCEKPQIKRYTAAVEKPPLETSRLAGYETPKGWVRQERPKELSVITFKVGDDAEAVYLTVSRFPGTVGGLYMNVNRWRGKVGLGEAKAEEIDKDVKKLAADGETVHYVDVAKESAGTGPRILGALTLPKHSSVSWVFMMTGPADAVERHKAEFEAFVQSVKFGMGAYDG
jgi:hypothetical protein